MTNKKIPEIWKIILFAILMIPFNYLGLYLQSRLGDDFLGFRETINFPMYIVMFYFGIQSYKNHWLDQMELKHALWGLLMWFAGQAFINPIAAGYGLRSEVMSRGFTVIGMSLFLIYAFKMLFNTQNRFTAILTRTAFAAYVIQMIPLPLVAGIYRSYMTQAPIINFMVIAILSVILSFLMAFVMCKLPILKRIF